MAKVYIDKGTAYIFCPGCKCHHGLAIGDPHPQNLRWAFNKDVYEPTFTPSLLCNGSHAETRCHSYITNGRIQFLNDCYHELRNQTVLLPEVDW